MPFRAPMPVVVLAVALVTAVLVALGVWQLQRHEWKQGIVAERNERIEAAPADAADLASLPAEEADYRRVTASGTWDMERAMRLANRGRDGVKGEEVVVPLLLGPDGPAVLVDRGWYPEVVRDEVLAGLAAEAEGTASVSGLARRFDVDGSRTPAGTWTAFDTEAMAEGLPYPVLPWVLVEGDLVERVGVGSGEFPVQGYERFRNTTPHLGYAATWFGLAAALVVAAVVRLVYVPRRHERRPPPLEAGGAREVRRPGAPPRP